MRNKFFYSICFGFILGVFFRSFISPSSYSVLLITLISFFLILFFALVSKNRWGLVIMVFILFLSLGVLRFEFKDKNPPRVLEAAIGEEVSLRGQIVSEPEIRANNQRLTVLVFHNEVAERKELKAKMLITTHLGEAYKYGDQVQFTGKINKPENFIGDNGKEFDYINYLRKDGVLYLMSYPDLEVLSRGHGNKIKSVLFDVKAKFLEKINYTITPPESLLLAGLILGERASFSEELREQFVDTGTIHIVALSGYNVTIVAEWFMKLFSFLPPVFGIWMGILAIFLFVVMTGVNATALRAGTMAVLALIARVTGRNYDVARGLVLAGALMIFYNPFILVYDISFQLSFIATVSVIFLAPRYKKYFIWVPKTFGLRDIVSVTCSAYIFVLPIILYKMGNLSIMGIPANILVLPFIPPTMIFGFATGFLGFVSHFLSVPIGYVTYLLLHYELRVIDILSSVPFASFTIPDFPLTLTILIYLYFIYVLFWAEIKKFFRFS